MDQVPEKDGSESFIHVLGTAQDGGVPQFGCYCRNCDAAVKDAKKKRLVASLALVLDNDRYLFDCSPDLRDQFHLLRGMGSGMFKGIFLTHLHLGHYIGLLQLGKEVYGADRVPVYCSESTKTFLSANEPFKSLIVDRRIEIIEIRDREKIQLTANVSVLPVEVPHRAEFSNTFGFVIQGCMGRKLLYIPDCDHWDFEIDSIVSDCDYVLLDGTFYSGEELPNRDLSKIPHPFVKDSIQRFQKLKDATEIYFTHFNHSNPCCGDELELPNGFHKLKEKQTFSL